MLISKSTKEAFGYLAVSVLFFVLYLKTEKAPIKPQMVNNNKYIDSQKPEMPDDKTNINDTPTKKNSTPVSPNIAKISSSRNAENHRVAGTSFRQKEIESLGVKNDQYEYTKTELIDSLCEDEKIYEYEFYPSDTVLVEEPDNQHDPNAIKVVIDGVHVGYIKKGSCSHIKKLINDNKIEYIDAEISGGKYKCLYSEFDYEKNKDVYRVEKDTRDYYITIHLHLSDH